MARMLFRGFSKISEGFRRFQKISEGFGRFPKISKHFGRTWKVIGLLCKSAFARGTFRDGAVPPTLAIQAPPDFSTRLLGFRKYYNDFRRFRKISDDFRRFPKTGNASEDPRRSQNVFPFHKLWHRVSGRTVFLCAPASRRMRRLQNGFQKISEDFRRFRKISESSEWSRTTLSDTQN